MKKNKYIISYSIQLVLTLAVLGAVIWYAQIMPINTPLVSAFNFDLAQFGIIIGLVIICLVYIFILVGFLVAAIRQKQKGSDHYLVSSARIILPIVFVFIAPFVFTLSFLTTESDKTLASPLTITLRHVQGFPLLRLLRKFRYHIGYSKAFFIAVCSSVPT